MRRLSLKVLALLTPFVALSVPALTHTVSSVVQAERSLTLRDGVFDPQLEGKWRSLVTSDTEIIVAGDSRAEREVNPLIIEQRTGRRTVNVATAAQDLITLGNVVKRHGMPAAVQTLIVSTSVFQVNDGAIGNGFLSTACLLNMTTRERVAVYADRLGSPWSPLAFTFADGPPATMAPERLQEKGFVGVDKQLSLPLPRVLLNDHPWYRSVSLHGARWRIFQGALDGLARTGRRVYLVQPPISPAWRAYTAGSFVETAEREFTAMLRVEAAQHANVRFLDFYSDADSRLGNEMFYDIQHLNRSGAAVFTDLLLERIHGIDSW